MQSTSHFIMYYYAACLSEASRDPSGVGKLDFKDQVEVE